MHGQHGGLVREGVLFVYQHAGGGNGTLAGIRTGPHGVELRAVNMPDFIVLQSVFGTDEGPQGIHLLVIRVDDAGEHFFGRHHVRIADTNVVEPPGLFREQTDQGDGRLGKLR